MSQFHWPSLDSLRKLSPEETADLAARVAELSQAGLPLGEGLRGLAAESSSRRLSRVLHEMADDLDAGADLAAAVESQGRRLPPHVRGLILAGLRSGRLAEALEEYVDFERGQPEMRGRLVAALAYPLLLLGLMTLLAGFFSWWIVGAFAAMFKDFNVDLPAMTWLVLDWARPVAWTLIVLFVCLLGMATLATGAVGGWMRAVVYRIPLIGPLLRYGDAAQFARLMALLLEQEVPLPDALRLSAHGTRDAGLARRCREVADEVERGRPLEESMAARPRFPASMIPLIQWGRQTSALPEAFRSAAEMFQGRVRVDGSLLGAILPPIALVIITLVVGFCVTALFLPLLSLIESLSSGRSNGGGGGVGGHDAGPMIAAILTFASVALIPALLLVYIWIRWQFDIAGSRLAILRFALIVAVVVALVVSASVGIVLGPAVLLIIVFVAAEVSRRHLATRQFALLWLLTVAAERSIPLLPAVEAFAREWRGAQGARARRLARLLESGMSLAGALRSVPDLVPPDVLPLVLLGCRSDNLPAALRRAATIQNRHDPVSINLVGKIFYLLLLFVYANGIVVFVMAWIVPKFVTMFRYFGVELPAATVRLIAASNWSIDYWYLYAPFVCAASLVCLFLVLRHFGWTRWDPPGIARLVRGLDSANILDGLALVAAHEGSLGEGMSMIALSHPKGAIRARLAQAAIAVEAGDDWADSLFDFGLIRRADRAVLQAAQRAGNLPWAIGEMADSCRRRFAYRLQAAAQTAFPFAVIGFGLAVMFIVVGLFLPLVSLINHLAQHI